MTEFAEIKLSLGIMSIILTVMFTFVMLYACLIWEKRENKPKETDLGFWGRPLKTSQIVTKVAIVLTIPGIVVVLLPLHKVFVGMGLMLLFFVTALVMTAAGMAIATLFRKNKNPRTKLFKLPSIQKTRLQSKYDAKLKEWKLKYGRYLF